MLGRAATLGRAARVQDLEAVAGLLVEGPVRVAEDDDVRAVAEAAPHPLEGIDVPVAGLSDLIRMKRAAGRDQDLADIEALTRDLEVDPEST